MLWNISALKHHRFGISEYPEKINLDPQDSGIFNFSTRDFFRGFLIPIYGIFLEFFDVFFFKTEVFLCHDYSAPWRPILTHDTAFEPQ